MKVQATVPLLLLGLFVCGHLLGRALPAGSRTTVEALLPPLTADAPEEELPPERLEIVELLRKIESGNLAEFPSMLADAFDIRRAEDLFLIGRLVTRWAEADVHGALAWFGQYEPETDSQKWSRTEGLRTLFAVWGVGDPRAAIEAGKSLDPKLGLGMIGVLKEVMRVTSKTDPEMFLELGLEYQENWRHCWRGSIWQYDAVYETLGRQDPDRLAGWLEPNRPEELAEAAARAAGKLAAEGGGDAYEQLAGIGTARWRTLAMEHAAQHLADSDVAAASEFAEAALGDGLANYAMMGSVIRSKALDDPVSTVRWIDRLQSDRERPIIKVGTDHRLWSSLYSVVPPDAAVMHRLATDVGPGETGFSINNLLASSAAGHQASLARDLLDLPQDEVRDEMLRTLVNHWGGKNPDAASTFVDALPEGELRSSVRQALNESQEK